MLKMYHLEVKQYEKYFPNDISCLTLSFWMPLSGDLLTVYHLSVGDSDFRFRIEAKASLHIKRACFICIKVI